MTATNGKAKRTKLSLVEIAEAAIAENPKSDIEAALAFFKEALPEFCKEDNDRLVKAGRKLSYLVSAKEEIPLEQSLELLVQDSKILIQPEGIKVPKVRFGKTELQMPIVSLGCMRFQQQWGDKITDMNQVHSECQDNLVRILKRSIIDFGINHLETARAYGCSELQMGCALKQLFMTGEVKREDLIIQTKVNIMEDPKEFRSNLETSFKNLQMDYVDLFGFHGFNGEWHYEWMFGKDGDNCWNVIQEYKDAGKIRFVGFSTHGSVDVISRAIETDKFDYVNLHHHFCGSYTASGDGPDGIGNLHCLRLLKERDMGAFVISIADKGGKVYLPARKLCSLTLPDLEPIAYGAGFLWNMPDPGGQSTVHTFSVGAARPADLDEFAVAAYLQGTGQMLPKVESVAARLRQAEVDTLGEDWRDTCFQGLVKSEKSKYAVEHTQIIWLYNIIKAWGMHQMANDRYRTLSGNRDKWDASLSADENIDKISRRGWGYMPGLSPEAGKYYFEDDIAGVPEKNRAQMKEAYEFVMKWCSKAKEGAEEEKPPKEWETAYEMRPWKDYPDKPYP